MKLAANLGFLYQDQILAARVQAAAGDGFDGVECPFPYALPAADCAQALQAAGLPLVLINTPLGAGGEPGLAAVPGRQADFRSGLQCALDYAHRTACPRVHVMAGRPGPQGLDTGLLEANLHWAADLAQDAGVTLLLEPLNRADMPGYAYHQPAQALALIQRLARPQLRLQFDLYHVRREGLDPLAALHSARDWIHHVQIAEAPRRSAPEPGRADTAAALRLVGALPHVGWLGLEYHPDGDTSAGLAWLPALRLALADQEVVA